MSGPWVLQMTDDFDRWCADPRALTFQEWREAPTVTRWSLGGLLGCVVEHYMRMAEWVWL